MDPSEFLLNDAIDHDILMHRETHFGGQFAIMIDYYEKEGKGVSEEFTLKRIRELQEIEKRLSQNLAAMLLTGAEVERVARAKLAYKKFKELYDETYGKKQKSSHPRLIADLVLSEELEPIKEIAAIVAEKETIVPSLMTLIKSEDFYDPLFPGYGLAPELAAQCLGQIGDRRAIMALFETLGEHDFAFEDQSLLALKLIGEPAKEFLLHVVHGRPITYDNERAAMVLVSFKDDPEVAKACLAQLKSIDLQKHPVLSTYLILACEGLQDPQQREEFLQIAKVKSTPSILHADFKAVSQHWNSFS